MKHSTLIQNLKNELGSDFSKIVKINKHTSSRVNSLTLLFGNEKDKNFVKRTLKLEDARDVQKRYGIGFSYFGDQFEKTESISDTLRLALEALESSKPTHSHYPEPKERHEKAIKSIKKQLEKI